MVQQLQLPHSSSTTGSNDNGGLPLQVANSIVASHLRCHGYEYTLSTFSPEAGVNLERVCVICSRVVELVFSYCYCTVYI